jgi:acetylornithine/LysW-gamma-L-lysine aminotransferase
VCTDAVAERMPRGGHGSTFAGSPLVCAAGAATLRALADPALHRRVASLGRVAVERLGAIAPAAVREVRGRGLMIGIAARAPVTPLVMDLQARGVLVLTAGRTVIRLLPPLVIDDEVWRESLEVIAEVVGGS